MAKKTVYMARKTVYIVKKTVYMVKKNVYMNRQTICNIAFGTQTECLDGPQDCLDEVGKLS